jgi:glucose-6-phosphate 1-dehydrogenase
MALNPPADQDIVVIGASGDLAARKLLPALYNLSSEGLLPRRGNIIGVAPVDWDDERFLAFARQAVLEHGRIPVDDARWNDFSGRLKFTRIDDSGDLGGLRDTVTAPSRLVYLAVPSSAFGTIIEALGRARLADGSSVIIEKPFGHDAATAHRLNQTLHSVFPEDRIFRIDHYLGKETVQNLLVFRFGNSVFERIWNRDAVESVEITVAESLGVEGRGRTYEETGAIRDIVQNHLFQVLAITCMEPPVSFDAEAIRNEKVKVLKAVKPIQPDDVVRGQYTAGEVDDIVVPGYRDEPGVSRTSETETYAAMRLCIDTWRWSGIPFHIRTGKRLRSRETRITVRFRDVPLHLFDSTPVEHVDHNKLVIRIQPDEGIALRFVAKQPGPEIQVQTVRMNFSYGNSFKSSPPEAYERLLHDALAGDHTLFIREDEVDRGWQIVGPVLADPPPLATYAAGTWGPKEAGRVVRPHGWESVEDRA